MGDYNVLRSHMTRRNSLLLFACLVLLLSGFIRGAIPGTERAALIALYNATNGDSWTDNSGWKDGALEADGFGPYGSEGTWYGITVESDHVTKIELDSNQLSGSIPVELENLSNLVHLGLYDNQLSGSIPAELGNLINLNWLDLDTNQLSGSIPSVLGNLSNLEDLFLDDNQLSGTIPAELGNLSNLRVLELDNNQLSGNIPAELGNLSNLTNLGLQYNQLSGTIPVELGNLRNLKWFSMRYNQLTGTIPTVFGDMSNLKWLWLDSNQLHGIIPTELGNLSNLRLLMLNSNKLTGSIPTSLTNLTNLDSMWTDIGYNGLYTNDNTLQTFLNSKDPDWEDTQTIAPSNLSVVASSTSSIRVSWTPIAYTGDNGGYKVYYSTTSGGPYTYSGITADKLNTYYDVTGLSPGTTYYIVLKTQTDSHSNNDNTVVSGYSDEVSATTTSPLQEIDPPFGSFETPIDGSTVVSSIPVTGWALDDTGIDNVKIYRQQGNSLVYIGDAALVEGARPDVAAAYPQYPNNTKAGWGYMMLTNFLPNGGNGTFVLYAIATDAVGKTTTLGTKTIICDNANAVKPFGAIDTPTQGGNATGSSFINWGWVLTPQPNSIPTDGSTINVYVDGVNLGHPAYNIYRPDIATLFPTYANSGGAVGYFYLDTTAYANGVHTIQWTAKDSGGNTDGIGSRYFSIQNLGSSRANLMASQMAFDIVQVSALPIDNTEPCGIVKGFNKVKSLDIAPNRRGLYMVEIEELERLKIILASKSNIIAGYVVSNGKLCSLPIGSTLRGGSFFWTPGPGFLGDFMLIFVLENQHEELTKREILVNIGPRR